MTEPHEFDVAWTSYRIRCPPELGAAIDELTPSTPKFRAPTHRVIYEIEAVGDSAIRLLEQGDVVGQPDDPRRITAMVRQRIRARLHQIAGLAGWAPLWGAVIGSGPVGILVVPGNDTVYDIDGLMSSLLGQSPVDLIGFGTCLIRPGQFAVIGRSPQPPGQRGEIAPQIPLSDVLMVETATDEIHGLSTPELMGRVLDSVVDRASHPVSTSATAVKALASLRAWRLPPDEVATTIRTLITRAG